LQNELGKMLGILVLIISFFLFFGITLFISVLPPAEILDSFLGFPEIISPISGVSGVVLVRGLVNGLFWGGLIFLSYRLIIFFTRKKIATSSDFLDYKTAPVDTSDYVPPLRVEKKPVDLVRKKTGQFTLDQGVEVIEGVGLLYGEKLRKSGVWTVNDLLKRAQDSKGRYALAQELGVAAVMVYKWVVQADFLRVKGVGKQYASLLESAGVDTVADLSRRNPESLYSKLKVTNMEKKLVKRIPPRSKIKKWVEYSKNLEWTVY